MRYSDGVEGELSMWYIVRYDGFKTKDGVDFFKDVFLQHNYIRWEILSEGIEIHLDPDACYANLLGMSREEVMSMPSEEAFYAAVEQARKERGLL